MFKSSSIQHRCSLALSLALQNSAHCSKARPADRAVCRSQSVYNSRQMPGMNNSMHMPHMYNSMQVSHIHVLCRVSSAQPSSSAPPSSTPPAPQPQTTGHLQAGPATAAAAAPSSEQSISAADKRGRQRIQWQPPTQAQRDEAVQVRERNEKDAETHEF